MAGPAHMSHVRALYKRILVLHRFLPIHLRALGDQYVKDEFRRHKLAAPDEVTCFMTEWQATETATCEAACTAWRHTQLHITVVRVIPTLSKKYKDNLQTQILESQGQQLGSVKFGAHLAEEHLKNFQEEQIGQLYELMLESTKPNNQFNIQEDTFNK